MAIEATIVNLRQSLSKALKDIKSIESYIFDLRHSLNVALIKQQETEKEYNHTLYEIKRWTRRAELAFINEKKDLVRVAILRKKHFLYQQQRINKQIKDNDNAIKLLTKQIAVWENEITRNIISEDKNTNLKQRLFKLELQVSYLQNEISDIAIRLGQSHSFSLPSEEHQLYQTKKMSVFEQLEVKLRELEQEDGMSLHLIDYELEELRAQLNDN